MAPDNQPMPLPILLRVPWFPPDPPPVVVVPQVHPVEDAGPRPLPLVISHNFRAARSPWRPARPGRRKGGIVILASAALLGGAIAWYDWPAESPDEVPPANSRQEVRPEPLPGRARGNPPRRAAHLSPEIIPLDAGETP